MSAGPVSKDASIYVAGHRGLVGSAIVRRLKAAGFTNILRRDPSAARSARSGGCERLVPANQPEYVFLVAGTVGGILANSTRPAEFIYDNLMIHATVVEASRRQRRQAAALPRELVHLPARLPAADSRGVSAQRPRSKRPTSPTPSPRSPASGCARHIAGSTAATSSRRCRRISTAPATTSISTELARASGADAEVPRGQDRRARRVPRSGEPARRGASSFTSTTSRTPACS